MSITIVGAGLAGLATAYRLSQANIEVQVLEACAYAGGRIQPAIKDGHQDLGPTWVWPYAQPVITQWIDELGLTIFDQFDAGSGLIDRNPNEFAIQQSLPSQYGVARIAGGTHALIAALLDKLEGIVRFEHIVKTCIRTENQWQLNVSTPAAKGHSLNIITDQLVIATTPRLGASILTGSGIELTGELNKAIHILQSTETWMAPHAKVLAVYETAFWREQGLSGRVASQVGPLVEIHDHCGPSGTPAALFGFAGVPAQLRQDNQEQFVTAIKQQLQRCFGENAPAPLDIIVKDWAFEPYTTTAEDRNSDGAHPQVLAKVVREPHCNKSLWFCASETSERSPGLIEGALARADAVVSALTGADT